MLNGGLDLSRKRLDFHVVDRLERRSRWRGGTRR